jgi:hypothetical protein
MKISSPTSNTRIERRPLDIVIINIDPRISRIVKNISPEWSKISQLILEYIRYITRDQYKVLFSRMETETEARASTSNRKLKISQRNLMICSDPLSKVLNSYFQLSI